MKNLNHSASFEFYSLEGTTTYFHIVEQEDGFVQGHAYSEEPSFWSDLSDVEFFEEVESRDDAEFFSNAMQCYVVQL
jgi:hypothetical protein